MEKFTLKELAVPMIKAIDSFNYLLKSHHRRVAVASYHIGKKLNLSNEDLLNLVIAASLHDIGALSVQERDMLIKEDVDNPEPHCVMGYSMLQTFDVFKGIAQIIKHHHIKYDKSLSMPEGEVPFACYIIYLADRVDVMISPDQFILSQKDKVISHIQEKVGILFHPDVYDAFIAAARSDIFWIDMNNMSIEQLFKELDFNFDVEMSFDLILEFALTMSKIVDFRSQFTASHSYTVAQLAATIGTYFGWSDEDCKKLKIAGYFHDIGKIGIDPGIIEKPGRLSDEEFQMIKLHPYFTEKILLELQDSEWFKDIVDWASNHHENIEGTGYPHAIHGQDVHTGTKILAFSDVITALLEDRPYRIGLPIEKAFNIIRGEIAPKISADMFEVIYQHMAEIDDIVQDCKLYSSEEYKRGKAVFH